VASSSAFANKASIADGCARAFFAAGANLAATYLNDKALPYVRPVTDSLGCKLLLPCDVRIPGQLEAVFERIRTDWGQLDFLLHAIAFAPADDLHGRTVDCGAAGFVLAIDVSCPADDGRRLSADRDFLRLGTGGRAL